jgi:hypothetical protein
MGVPIGTIGLGDTDITDCIDSNVTVSNAEHLIC